MCALFLVTRKLGLLAVCFEAFSWTVTLTFFFLKVYCVLTHMNVCFLVSVCIHVWADEHRSQKRMPVPMELESLASVSCQLEVLGTELQSSGRMAGALNH